MRRLGQTLVASLRDAWENVADLTPVIMETALSPDFIQAALPGDICALLLLDVRMLDLSGTISLCIPYQVVEPIMDRLSAQAWYSSAGRKATAEDDEHARVAQRLREVDLPLSVELGSTTISVTELMGLREGDVLRLDQSADRDVAILIGGHKRFLGQPGVRAGNRAVQVTDVLPVLPADAPG